jgi:hypothetical protein
VAGPGLARRGAACRDEALLVSVLARYLGANDAGPGFRELPGRCPGHGAVPGLPWFTLSPYRVLSRGSTLAGGRGQEQLMPDPGRHPDPSPDPGAGPDRDAPPGLDATRAHPARIYDYWLGGCFL